MANWATHPFTSSATLSTSPPSKTPTTAQQSPPRRQPSAGEGSCRPPATIYRISLTDGAGRALLRRDVPRGPPSRGRPLRQRRTLSPAPSLCCWQTALFEIMRMGSNRRPRMRSSSAAVAWTSTDCREAIDGLGGRRRPPLMVVQPHWQNGCQRCAKLVKQYASLRNRPRDCPRARLQALGSQGSDLSGQRRSRKPASESI